VSIGVVDQASINHSDAIFLTGATGLVGGLLLRRMAEQNPSRAIFALVRSSVPVSHLPNTRLLRGDISEPRLGLTWDLYSQICKSVGTIVHCAASTKFSVPLPLSRKVNVEGTENILELASNVKRLKVILHVSTVHVAGRKSGVVRETQFTHSDGWFNPYEQSKFEAEKLICKNAGGLPWVITRLSTIVGNSLTGKISQFNYFHQLLRLIPGNRFPIIPGSPETAVDVVPDDWAVEALQAILRGNPASGSIFHLCAGPSQAVAAQEILEMAFRLHYQNQPRSASAMPHFVSVDEFETLVKGLERKGQMGLARMAEMLLLYLPHLDVRQSFLNENTNQFLKSAGIVPRRTHDYLSRIIQSCL
jgi:thioester reductase-like protein